MAMILCSSFNSYATTETFTTGAFIINMGVTPQTVNNGLRPYGLIYDLIKNQDVVVKWVISQTKVKDGTDFTYNGVAYKGGTFIIPAEYRTAAVNTTISNWQALGVVGVTTTTPMLLDVTLSLRAAPNWAMDASNGNIAIKFLQKALIPASAYYFRTPATLNNCDDLYVMPHADPKWATHSNLYFWNKNAKGGIWGGCHAVSAMEGPNCVNPGNAAQNLKFLSTGGLVQWTAHADGTPPYSYSNVSDPVFQIMGTEDAAHQNGSEQIYLPLKIGSTWNPSVKIGCYDATHNDIPALSNGPASVTLYGRAFNDTTRGFVMYQGGHDIGGTTSDEVSAQRQFFNWSFLVATDKSPNVTYTNIPATMNSLQLYNNLTATPISPVGMTSFTYQWYSSVGGTFSTPTDSITNFTPPALGSITSIVLYCKITDGCGRSIIDPKTVSIIPGPTAPNAVNDTISFTNLCSTSSYTINVLSNDFDINGNMINSITFVGGGNYGTFINNGNGSITYNPGWLFQGNDTLRYEVCDNTPLCSQATIVVKTGYSGLCAITTYQRTDTAKGSSVFMSQSITNPDSSLGNPDQADNDNTYSARFNNVNDSIIIQLNAAINIGDTVRIRAASDDNNCTDFTAQGSLTSGGFVNGVNSVNLQIPASTNKVYNYYNFIVTGPTQYIKIKERNIGCGNKIDLDAITANYRSCVSNVPAANKDNVATAANVSVTTNVRTNDTEPQGRTLSISIVSNPAHGTASVNAAGNIIYAPDSAYSGADTLIYKACNSDCLCDTAFVIYNVQTHPPCGSGSASYYINGNASSVTSNTGVTNPNNALGIPDANDGNNALTARINNVVNDNIVLDLTDTVYSGDTIVVRMSSDNNTAVTIRVQGNLTNAWGSPTTSTDFNLPGGAGKTYADYNFILAADARYIRLIQISTAAIVDVDALSYDYWYCDVIPNRQPAAANDTVTTYVNRAVYMDVLANDVDPDNDPITHSIISPSASHGTGVVSGTGILYTPNFGYTGTDTVTYKVCDNGTPSLCDTAIFIITISPGPPVAITNNSSTNSNTFVTVNVQANDTLSVTGYTYTTSLYPAILSPSNGTAVLVGNSIKYTPNANFTGIDSLAYQLCDNGSPVECDTTILYVTVNNQLPTANADADTTSACNSVILNVLSNDTDPESGVLTVSSVSVPSSGTAVISNNQIVYTPVSSPVFTGVATFTYQVCDNGSPQQCVSGNVSVTVNGVYPPSAPPNAINDIDSTYINQPIYISVLANDTDPDGDSLEVDSTATGLIAPTRGTIQYQANGQIKYIPNNNSQGIDSFEYRVCDIHHFGGGCVNIVSSCRKANVLITVKNRYPAANDDFISTINSVSISGNVGTNDYEPDGQTMSFSVITGPITGILFFNSDGSFTFNPDGMYIGPEIITYLVCDGANPLLCDTAILTINISVTNVPPNSVTDTIITNSISTYIGDVSLNDMDPNGDIDPNSFTITTYPNNGTIILNTDGSFTFNANIGFAGIDYAYYQVCDLAIPSLCSSAMLVIMVPDSAPVTFNENNTINEDNVLTEPAGSGILSNGDYDPNGTALILNTTPLVNPSHGGVVVQSNGAFTYTPSANFNGSDYFVVNICDSTPLCSADTVFITVNPVNDPIVLANDSAFTNEGVGIASTIFTASDYDIDSTIIKANIIPVSGPNHGFFFIDTMGLYVYTPDAYFHGIDTVVINVCDRGNPLPVTCGYDTIFITTNAINDPPVIISENATTNEDVPLNGTVLDSSDFDPDSTALLTDTIPVYGPFNGIFTIAANGSYTYTPAAGFYGIDTVILNICDSGYPFPSFCDYDTLFITINPVNDPIVLVNENKSTNEDTPANGTIISAGDYDPDTTAITVNTTPVSGPSHGGIVINAAGNYTYTPSADFNGADTIVFSVCDSGNPMPPICGNDTLFITVNAVNDAIVLANENNSTNEDTPLIATIITAGDYDPDTTAITVNTTPVSGPYHGGVVINAAGNYTYTPAANYNGTDFIVFSVCDAGTPMPVTCGNDTLFITINPVNDPVVLVNENNITNEDIPLNGTIITAGDYDIDTTILTVNTIPVSGPSHGGIAINGAGNYTYTPAANFNGTDFIVFSVCDTGTPMPATCSNDTLFLTVNAVNDPPVIINDSIIINEDSIITGTIITTDYDPDSTTLVVDTVPLSGPNHGSITIDSTGTFTYSPDPDFNGSDTVIISICDTGSPLPVICVNDTIIFNYIAVNDTSVIANDNNSTNEDTPLIGTIINAGDYDPDSTTLIVNTTPVSGPSHGGIVINAAGNYTYTPSTDYNGTDMVVFSVCDSGNPLPAICVNDTLFLTINAVNDSPVIVNDSITINEDSIITGTIITTDFDPDSTTLVVDTVPLFGPNHGIITIDSTGTFTYTPDPNFNGSDTVIINICDTGNPLPVICISDTLIFNFTAVNDPPVLANDTASTNEITLVGGNILTAGDFDPDTTILTVTTVPVYGPVHGVFNIDSAGNYTYTPNLYFNGSDTIVISVCDSGTPLPAICSNDTLFVTINGTNSAPTITNDTAVTNEDTPVNGTVITGSDWDPEGMPFTADTIPVSGPSHGTIIINSNGTYTYTPAANYNGTDLVVISVCDVGTPPPDICINDTLFITINPVNDTVIIINDNVSTNEDIPVSGNIITAGDYDVDTTALTVNTVPVSGPYHGMIVIDNAGNYNYTPNPDFNGNDTVVFNICDAGTPLPATCVNDTLIIIVNPINDTLIVVNDTISTNEGTSVNGTILTSSDYDPDTTVMIVNTVPIYGPNNGIIVVNTNGIYSYTPDSLFNGMDTVVLVVCDSGNPLPATCENDTLFITVNMINDTPVITNDAITVNEDTFVNGTVINASDADPDGTALTADTIPVNGPNHGTISVNPNGSYTYIPNLNYNGIDTVVITICDTGLPLPAICVNDTLIITINPMNDIPAVNNENTSLCSGSSVQASVLINDSDIDLDGLTISSLIQPADGSASTNGTTIIYTPDPGFIGSDSVIYDVCDNGIPQLCAQGTLYITVNGINGTAITASEVLCTGDSTGSVMTTPVGNAPFTFLWSNGAVTQNIINVPAGTYTVTITDSLGCSLQDSASISEPNSALAVSGSITDVKCFGDSTGSIILTVSGGTAPYNYLWTNGDITKDLLNAAANFYSVTITDAHGCTQMVSQPVSQPSAAISISGVSTPSNCLGGIQGAIDVTVNGGTPGYTYNWSSSEVTEDISSMPGTYTIIVTDSNGCIDSATFTINDSSTLIINSSGAVTFCDGDSTVLSSSASGGIFQWSQNGIALPGATNNTLAITTTGTYSLTQINSCGTFTSNSITVSVNPNPVLSVTGILAICENLSTQLTVTGANSYLWTPSSSLENDTSNSPTASPLTTTIYTVTGTNLGCSSDTTVTVIVNASPVVTVTAGPHDCKNGTQLNAAGANGYLWQPAIGLDTINIPSPLANPEFTTTYTVTAFSSNLCFSTASIAVIIECDSLIIPNGFSPNNDGVNDRFVIDGLEDFPVNSFQVFNRWGSIIYSKDKYDNSWDGTSNTNGLRIGSGKIPTGTYFYILNLGEAEQSKSGYIIVKY